MRVVFQSEAAECGLACLAMIGQWHGEHLELSDLRDKVGAATRGMNLRRLINAAEAIGLVGTAYRVDLDALRAIAAPVILHWEFDHFVVLRGYRRGRYEILDPAVGRRWLHDAEMSRRFTGVMVEFARATSYAPVPRKTRPAFARVLLRTRGVARSLGAIGLLALGLEICGLIAPQYLQFAIDNAVSSSDLDILSVFALGFLLVVTVQALLGYLRGWSLLVLTQSLSLQWMSNILGHLVRLPVAFFEQRRLGDLVSRFGSAGAIQQAVTVSALEAVLDGLMALASLAAMFLYSPRLAVVTLSVIALQALVRVGSYGILERLANERIIASARESTFFLETMRAMMPIKLFGSEVQRREGWQSLALDVQRLDIRKGRIDVMVASLIGYLAMIESVLVIWLGAGLALKSNSGFTIGMLIVYIAYKTQFSARANNVAKFLVDLRMIRIHADRLSDIVLARPEPAESEVDASSLPAKIEFRDVGFRYGVTEPWVLRNVSFTIEPGESVALTGASGGGKTTLVKLLLGILEPTEGEILYGGRKLGSLGARNVRRIVGTVMQEDLLLNGTIRQNIAFFDERADAADVEHAAAQAHIHADIAAMPMGYLTRIGDMGAGLSGGQKQRLLLARAIFKRPKVLVLDEATSHLDTANEAAVNAAIEKLQVTRIIVAHRASTIASAARALHVRGGQVLEAIASAPESAAA